MVFSDININRICLFTFFVFGCIKQTINSIISCDDFKNFLFFSVFMIFSFFSISFTVVAEESVQLEDMTVESTEILEFDQPGELNLTTVSETGRRLGLTPLETPASVDIINSSNLEKIGAQNIADALETLPGVISGAFPASPASFSIRGFTTNQITLLRDGIWLGPANMSNRPQNACNLDRIELLRGPASGMHGQGAVAGAINAVTKQAEVQNSFNHNAEITYGRWDSYQACAGSGGPLTDSLFYRLDISEHGSDGFVDDMDPESTNFNGSLLWQATDTFSIKVSADYLEDELPNYWGTPLVPASVGTDRINGVIETAAGEVLDERTRDENYNVTDQIAESDQMLWRTDLEWQPYGNLRLRNTSYYFDANRDWFNAEGFIFNQGTGLIDRTNGFFFVQHEQEVWGNKFDVTTAHQLFGRENQIVAGFDYQDIDFERTRGFRFSAQPGDSVDLFNPVQGVYGPREPRGVSPTDINTWGIFLEDAFQIHERFSLVAGLRYENLHLRRKNIDLRPATFGQEEASGFSRNFDSIGFRLGGVFSVTPNMSIYAQYSDAQDPVNSNIFLVNSGEDFDLTDAKQWEVGLKASNFYNTLNFTAAYFNIERDDVSEQIGVDSAVNVGGRESEGFEIALNYVPIQALDISANVAYVDAEFEDSINFVTFGGNTPPNVPDWTANLWVNARPFQSIPIELGARLRYVDDRFGTNDNTVVLEKYTLLDLSATYRWHNKLSLTARARNVTDEDYVPWVDVFYLQQTDPGFPFANQVLLGEPRSYEATLSYHY
jgi:iron complex outermembrane receptor protein